MGSLLFITYYFKIKKSRNCCRPATNACCRPLCSAVRKRARKGAIGSHGSTILWFFFFDKSSILWYYSCRINTLYSLRDVIKQMLNCTFVPHILSNSLKQSLIFKIKCFNPSIFIIIIILVLTYVFWPRCWITGQSIILRQKNHFLWHHKSTFFGAKSHVKIKSSI